eukprot:EG_transcript_3094
MSRRRSSSSPGCLELLPAAHPHPHEVRRVVRGRRKSSGSPALDRELRIFSPTARKAGDNPALIQSCPAYIPGSTAVVEDGGGTKAPADASPPETPAEPPSPQAALPHPPSGMRPRAPARVSFCHDPYGWAEMEVDSGPASCPATPSHCAHHAPALQQQLRMNVERGIHGGALLAYHISQALTERSPRGGDPFRRRGSEDESHRSGFGGGRSGGSWPPLGSEELSEWDDTQSCSTESASRSAMPPEREGPAVRIAPCVLPLVPETLERRRAFLTHPIPRACGTVQCTIQRDRRLMGARYILTLEVPPHPLLVVDENGQEFVDSNVERATSVFVCAARKLGARSCFLLSADREDFDRQGKAYAGKCQRTSPLEYVASTKAVVGEGKEVVKCPLATIYFTEASKDIPSQVRVALPTDGAPPGSDSEPKVVLQSMSPVWNPRHRAYELDMGPRVHMASSKNLQLEDAGDFRRAIRLTFGKVDDGHFVLDFAYPLSVFQAFSIALASFDVL